MVTSTLFWYKTRNVGSQWSPGSSDDDATGCRAHDDDLTWTAAKSDAEPSDSTDFVVRARRIQHDRQVCWPPAADRRASPGTALIAPYHRTVVGLSFIPSPSAAARPAQAKLSTRHQAKTEYGFILYDANGRKWNRWSYGHVLPPCVQSIPGPSRRYPRATGTRPPSSLSGAGRVPLLLELDMFCASTRRYL